MLMRLIANNHRIIRNLVEFYGWQDIARNDVQIALHKKRQ
jgi:uncharacterized protein (DUF2132 family)